MAAHDPPCVPAPEEGRAGTNRYPRTLPAGTEPLPGCSRSRVGSSKGRGKERVRAFLEIQVRQDGPGACARVLSWRPRRRGASSAGRSPAGKKVLELIPEGAS